MADLECDACGSDARIGLCQICSDTEDAELATLRADLARVTEERDEARASFLRCAQAIGVVYQADGHNDHPGPVDEVVRYIEEARAKADENDALRARPGAVPDEVRDTLICLCQTERHDPESEWKARKDAARSWLFTGGSFAAGHQAETAEQRQDRDIVAAIRGWADRWQPTEEGFRAAQDGAGAIGQWETADLFARLCDLALVGLALAEMSVEQRAIVRLRCEATIEDLADTSARIGGIVADVDADIARTLGAHAKLAAALKLLEAP